MASVAWRGRARATVVKDSQKGREHDLRAVETHPRTGRSPPVMSVEARGMA